jgi:hypothetical protein
MLRQLGFGAHQAVDAQEPAAIFGVVFVILGPAQASVDLLRLVTTLGGFASLQLRWKRGRVRCLVRAVSLLGQHLRSAAKMIKPDRSPMRGKKKGSLPCDVM